MDDQNSINRFIGVLMICGLLLGGSGFALAAVTDAAAGNQEKYEACVCIPGIRGLGEMNTDVMGPILDSLASDGTVTRAQADQILAAIKERAALRQAKWEKDINMTREQRQANREQGQSDRSGILECLVGEGTLTQTQADTVQAAVREKRAADRQAQLDTALDMMVEKNIINNEQAAVILDEWN